MSFELLFEGDPVGSERVADAWEEIELAFGPERLQALEDAGLSVEWGDDHLELSFPAAADAPSRFVDLVARELGERFDWELSE